MKLSLTMVTAEGTARDFPVSSLPVVLGRGDEAKVRIPLASVSRRHCEIFLDDEEEPSIRDLGSSNGTYVNGERVKGHRELIPGDVITLGPVVFVVKIDGHPKDVDASASYATGTSGAAASSAGSQPAIAGVPTWTGTAPKSDSGAGKAAPAQAPAGGPLKETPHKAPPPPKKGVAEDADLDSILGDLSESDFDIDFSDIDDKPKK